jgi:WD40 repeat protein
VRNLTSFVLAVSISSPAYAQAPAELELRPVRDLGTGAIYAVLSSDGKRVLVANRNDTFSVLDADKGTELLSLAAKPQWEDMFDSYLRPECFSPDGARVLIPSRAEARAPDQWGGALLLIAEAGKKPVEIRPARSSSWFGAWSDDGKHVYFIDGGHRKEPGYSIRRWSAESGKSESIHEKKDRLACGLRRSPDGTKLAFCDFQVDNGQVRIVVLSLKDGKAQESAPFPVDDAGADGIRPLHWEPQGNTVLYSRSPDGERKPEQRERHEMWRFDAETGKSTTFLEGKPLEAMILGPADKDHWFAGSMGTGRAEYFLVDRKGNRTKLGDGTVGLGSAGKNWLMLDARAGKLSLVRPLWILK